MSDLQFCVNTIVGAIPKYTSQSFYKERSTFYSYHTGGEKESVKLNELFKFT